MKLVLVVLSLFSTSLVFSQDLCVIANEKGAPSQLKLSELQSIFQGKTTKWSNGSKVVLAMMKTNTEAGQATCQKIYQLNADEVKKFWLTQSMKGIETPVFFSGAAELILLIVKTPGAIGIMEGSDAPTGSRLVTVDGKKNF
jgi:ABC-type phosphate transport system substrate-binding protein